MYEKNSDLICQSLALTGSCVCDLCGRSLALAPMSGEQCQGDCEEWAQSMAQQLPAMGWSANGEQGGFRCSRCGQ